MKPEVKYSEALSRINGSIVNNSVIYYDDSTQRWYVGPVADLDYLAQLINDDDEAVSNDAYSHWCAGTSHDEYETEEQANAAALK
jgi:hypothetical protein